MTALIQQFNDTYKNSSQKTVMAEGWNIQRVTSEDGKAIMRDTTY